MYNDQKIKQRKNLSNILYKAMFPFCSKCRKKIIIKGILALICEVWDRKKSKIRKE